jgi:hypothetical protein
MTGKDISFIANICIGVLLGVEVVPLVRRLPFGRFISTIVLIIALALVSWANSGETK